MNQQTIELTEKFVQKEMGQDATGHDWFHVDRVRKNALNIWKQEQTGDPYIIELAALLHDISDEKLNDCLEAGEAKLEGFLNSISIPKSVKQHIKQIIDTISYKGGRKTELASIEA